MGGYQLMVANDVFRGRFRKSFETPAPVEPNQVTAYAMDLHAADYRFKKGPRIMVQVQSTWFPLIDRNPQRSCPTSSAPGTRTMSPPCTGSSVRRSTRRTWKSRSPRADVRRAAMTPTATSLDSLAAELTGILGDRVSTADAIRDHHSRGELYFPASPPTWWRFPPAPRRSARW